jgi:hypothetical protein
METGVERAREVDEIERSGYSRQQGRGYINGV